VFFNNQLPPQRNHEQNTQPTAEQRQRKNSPERELFSKPQKDQGGS